MPRNFENNSSRPDFSNFKPKHKSEISSRRLLGDDPDNNNSGKRGFRPAFGIDSPDSEEESLIPQAQSTMVRDRHDSQTSWNAKLLEKNKDSNPFSLGGKGGDSKRKFSRSRSRDSRSPPRRRGGRSRSRTPRSRSRSPYYPNGKKRQNYSRSPPARRRFSRSPPRRRRDSPPRSRYDQGLGPRGRYPKTRAGPVDLGPRTNDDFDVVKGKNVPDFITGTRHPEQRIRKKDPYALPGMNSRSRSRDSEPNAPIGPVDRDSRDSRSRSRDSRSKSRSRSRSRSLPSRYVRRSRTRSPPVKRETNNYGYGRSLRKSRSRSRSPLPPRRRFSPSRSRSPPRRKNKVKNSPPPARRDRSITPLESLEREHRQKYNRNDSRNRDSLERNGRRDRRRRSRSLSTEKAFARLSVTRKIESRSPSRSRSPPRNRSSAKNNSRKSPEIIRKVRDIRSRSRSRSNSRSRSSAKNRVETSRNASPSGRISAKDRLGIKKNNKDRRDNDNWKSGRDDHAYSSKNIRNQTRDEERLGIPSKKIPTDDPNRVRGQCRFVDKNGRVKRHIKNTESFEPNYIPMQMRVRSVSYQENKKYPFEFAHNDSVLVNDMYYDFKPNEIYDTLLEQIHSSRAYKNDPKSVWKLWHGDNHLIADDKADWKKDVPIFNKIMERIETFFNMEIKATRFNWYRDDTDWKPFHFDAAAVKPDKARTQNLTIGVSFGRERDICFEHADNRATLAFPLCDGSLFGFGKEINCEWRHGIPQLEPGRRNGKGRISIIAWGLNKQVDSM